MNLIDQLNAIELKERIPPEESLLCKFEIIKRHFIVREDMIKTIFPLYTLHNHKHSEAIISILSSFELNNKLLPMAPLNRYELFFLLAAAYIHDIGMAVIKEEDKSNCVVNIQSIREKHALRSHEYITSHNREMELNEFEAEIIGLIAKGHGNTNLYRNPVYNDKLPFPGDPGKIIRVKLLTSLLRVADILDISYLRIEPEVKEILEKYTHFDVISNLHWFKHYYTTGFISRIIYCPNSNPELSIKLSFQLPEDDYVKGFIIPFIVNPIQREIDYLQNILGLHGFSITLAPPPYEISWLPGLKKIEPQLYDDIFNYLLKNENIRVLIVDDDKISRDDFSVIVQNLGYQVDTAIDSVSAWEKINDHSYHLILLDLRLPDFDNRIRNEAGLELLQKINKIGKKHIVLIMSALEQSQLIIDCLKNRAYDYILKDSSKNDIKLLIDQALRMNFHLLMENHRNEH